VRKLCLPRVLEGFLAVATDQRRTVTAAGARVAIFSIREVG
jgi:hypothetical protein